MNSNLFNPSVPKFNETVAGYFAVPGGALGWIDTDVSGTLTKGLAFFMVLGAAAQDAGVRKLGSAVDTKHTVANGIQSFAGVALVAGGHVELYRAAANNEYCIIGWLNG